jgi:CTD kinase subunit beta
VALGSIFVSALLLSFEQPPSPSRENETPAGEIAKMLNTDSKEGWEARYHAKPEDLEGIFHNFFCFNSNSECFLDFAHTVLDLLIQYATNPSANTSPSTPSSPSPNLPARDRLALAQQPQYPYKADQLIRLKIAMRETEHPARRHKPLGNSDPSALYSNDKIGQNEGTVRFLFSPPGFEGDNMV